MINITNTEKGFLATFLRGGYLNLRGTGKTKAEALTKLRNEIETMLIFDERMVAQQTDAIEDIDKMLG